MRSVPRLDGMVGYIDFREIDAVVDNIKEAALEILKGPALPTQECSIKFQHQSSGIRVPVADFGRYLGEKYGGTFEEVDMRKWIAQAAKAGIDPLITAYLEDILESGSQVVFPYMGEGQI
ncbi:hypothetical protein McanMca71_005390 [Microsporum canis]